MRTAYIHRERRLLYACRERYACMTRQMRPRHRCAADEATEQMSMLRALWHDYVWLMQEYGLEWMAFLLGALIVVLANAYKDMR